jgi:hypothetical protein
VQVQTQVTLNQLFAYDNLVQLMGVMLESFPTYGDLIAKLQTAIDATGQIVDPAYSTFSTVDRMIDF